MTQPFYTSPGHVEMCRKCPSRMVLKKAISENKALFVCPDCGFSVEIVYVPPSKKRIEEIRALFGSSKECNRKNLWEVWRNRFVILYATLRKLLSYKINYFF